MAMLKSNVPLGLIEQLSDRNNCTLIQLIMPFLVGFFLPRDATQSAVLLWQVVCPSVCLSVRNVEVL